MHSRQTGAVATVQFEDTAAFGRVLIVDDDVAFGGFMLAALESRGHDADWAGSVADALATLYASRYDLVLIDWRLPDGSGFDLLRQASEAGLLAGSAAVMLTGYEFEEPCDVRVFRKPSAREVEPLLDRFGALIALAKRRRETGPRSSSQNAAGHDGQARSRRARVELVLYTSAASEKCQRAVRTIQNALTAYAHERVLFTIVDLSNAPEAGDEDAVVFTPTLVKRGPGPRTYIVGNLDDPRLVTDLLDVSGVPKRMDGNR
ncbi:MAG: response regulator [Vicinamibacterales bacterium]